MAERERTSPYPPGAELAARGAYLGQVVAGGDYPHLAAAFMEDPGPIDYDAFFERALTRVLDGFAKA
jgi:hypothetical protein